MEMLRTHPDFAVALMFAMVVFVNVFDWWCGRYRWNKVPPGTFTSSIMMGGVVITLVNVHHYLPDVSVVVIFGLFTLAASANYLTVLLACRHWPRFRKWGNEQTEN